MAVAGWYEDVKARKGRRSVEDYWERVYGV
jgi:hypothetical protein